MTKAGSISLSKTLDILLTIKDKQADIGMFDEKDTDYDIVDFEKRFETNIVFNVGESPEALGDNMKVLKQYGDYKNSEYRERGKNITMSFRRKKSKKKVRKKMKSCNFGRIEDDENFQKFDNFIQDKYSTNRNKVDKMRQEYHSLSKIAHQQESQRPRKMYIATISDSDSYTNIALKDQNSHDSDHDTHQLSTSRSNIAEIIIGGRDKNKTVRIQETLKYPKSDLSATCRQRSHDFGKKNRNFSFSNLENKNINYSTVSAKRHYIPEDKDCYLLEQRYQDYESKLSPKLDFSTMEYKELCAYNQKLEGDLHLLKDEFKKNMKKMIDFKKKEKNLKQKNEFLEQQVMELKEGYEVLKTTTLSDLKASTEKSDYLEQKVGDLLKVNEELQNELHEIKIKTREIFENSDSTKNIILNLQEENEELRDKIDFLKKEFEVKEDEAKKQEKTIQELKSANEEQMAKTEEMEEKIKKYEITFEDNNNEFAMDLQIIEKLQEENKIHLQEKNQFEQNYLSLENQMGEMNKQYKQDLEESENNINALLTKIAELEAELLETNHREEEISNNFEILENRNLELEVKMKKYKKKNLKLKKGYRKLEKKIDVAFESQKNRAMMYQYDSYSDGGVSSGTDDDDYEEFLEYKCYK